MEYNLNQLRDPAHFQRLVNGILVARFGEDVRLTPLHGADGGSDGETAPDNPTMEFNCKAGPLTSNAPLVEPPRPGRYLFQAKYHRTGDRRLSGLRQLVVREFEAELRTNVLSRRDRNDVNYFFVVTNVPASKDAIDKIEAVRRRLLRGRSSLYADVWWGERISTFLDWSPELWLAFPEIFPGSVPPYAARILDPNHEGLARTFRLAIRLQHSRDLVVKFRQVELDHQLLDLFVDIDVYFRSRPRELPSSTTGGSVANVIRRRVAERGRFDALRRHHFPRTALQLLINDEFGVRRILLEGGPGQGKSTITQMAAQVYRQRLLGESTYASRDPAWHQLSKSRFPIRLDLGGFAEWLSGHSDGALEQYMSEQFSRDAGGESLAVRDIHAFVEGSPVILLLDGLDEIGSDSLRDRVLDAVMETIERFEEGLGVDLRVVLTSRPPALAGRRQKLEGFERAVLAPMDSERIDEYLERWLVAQIPSSDERARIRGSFQARRFESHVEALARNPMQLSVLLQFIYLKGEAFPDRRAELYADYFKTVIDRDVEKSPELRRNRDLVERLHSFLGFYFHGATELGGGSRSWNRREIVELAGRWLEGEGGLGGVAEDFFALGEERFGLIVAISGEGDETTYGFEVQPIQEYFAAAYISNLLAGGGAHEVFQLLVHRSYWREVALFLAGLRRPNEKADLIARAKAADQDPAWEWEQNGRSIVLELLREGVLQEPGHVLMDAMDFVVDLLDVKELLFQRRPEGLVESIGELGRQYPTDALRKRIAGIAEAYCRSDDAYALSAVYRVAARLLSADEYQALVLRFRGEAPRSRSLVRLTCPYGTPEILEKLAAGPDYWADVPLPVSARRFWRAALRHGVVLDVKHPAELHLPLVVEFATDDRAASGAVVDVRPSRPLAVWQLQQNVQAMLQEGSFGADWRTLPRAEPVTSARGVWSERSGGDLSYEGLPSETGACLGEVIEASNRFLVAWGRGDQASAGESLEEYLNAIRERLDEPGLSAWVAGRCAIGVLQGQRFLRPLLQNAETLEGVFEALREHYDVDVETFRFLYAFPLQRLPLGAPDRVRLRRGMQPVPLHEVVTRFVSGRRRGSEEEEALQWVEHAPLSGAVIKSLVEVGRGHLPQLLRFLAERTLAGLPRRARLRVQDTQRVLKICRGTDDQEILKGAATILFNATFARIAEPVVVAKILAAAPASQFATRVLRTARESFEGGGGDGRGQESVLSRAVAELVLSEPGRYPARILSRAGAVAAEINARSSTPLFEERPELLGPAQDAN